EVDVDVLTEVDVDSVVVAPHRVLPLSLPLWPPPWFWSQLPLPPPLSTHWPFSECWLGGQGLPGPEGGAASAIAATTPADMVAARSAIRNVLRSNLLTLEFLS